MKELGWYGTMEKEEDVRTFPLGILGGEQDRIVRPRHTGTQLGNGSMLVVFPGTNTASCPWRNENWSQGFVSQDSMWYLQTTKAETSQKEVRRACGGVAEP